MATQWYSKSGSGQRGPMAFGELIELVRTGAVTKADFVRSNWHKDWQQGESVLRQFFPSEPSPASSPWTETVNAAVAAAGRRGDRGQKVEDSRSPTAWPSFSGLGIALSWLFWPFAWIAARLGWAETLIQWFDDLAASVMASPLLKPGVQAACGLVGAGLAALVIRDLAAQESLRHFLATAKKAPPEGVVRCFPVIGACSPGEYAFAYFDALLVAAAIGYFVSGWILSQSDD